MKKIIPLTLILVVALGFVACEEDEPSTKFEDITLNCGKSYTIPNGSGTTWTSSNEYIASISGNVVTAELVGDATISSTKGSFKVSVKGVVPNAYTIPCLNWGASKSTVKSFMSGQTIYEETSTSISYKGTGTQILTLYTFENSKLISSGLALNGDYIDSDNLIDFILERYIPLTYDEDNYSFYFITPDGKTGLGLTLNVYGDTLVYIIAYVPFENSSRSISAIDWTEFDKYGFKKSDLVKTQFEKIKTNF
jgi:hypothetical protein